MTPMELDRANAELKYLLAQQCALIEQQAKEIARLREALENIVEGEGLWTKRDMAHEAHQALKEEHP